MGENKKHKIRSTLILAGIASLIAFTTILATTPLHEGLHWVMSDIDPCIKPIKFVPFTLFSFDESPFNSEQNFLSSPLGYVVVEEAYPGAFNDRPAWADALQEIICVLSQIVIACIVILKSLKLLVNKYPSAFGA